MQPTNNVCVYNGGLFPVLEHLSRLVHHLLSLSNNPGICSKTNVGVRELRTSPQSPWPDPFLVSNPRMISLTFPCLKESTAPIVSHKSFLKNKPPVKSYILPIHRNGHGQTGKFRSTNIFWPALERCVLPLSIIYLKTKPVNRFAEECYFIEVRPLTIWCRDPAPCIRLIQM